MLDGFRTIRPVSAGRHVPGEPSTEVRNLSIDQPHVALPKLYGAPAYARPAAPVAAAPRPFDPDELPIEATMSDEERDFALSLPARAYAPGGAYVASGATTSGDPVLRPRSRSIRSIAGRLLGGSSRATASITPASVTTASVGPAPEAATADIAEPDADEAVMVGEGGLEPPTSEV